MTVLFTPIKQHIYDLVRRRPGITHAELFAFVYADGGRGGRMPSGKAIKAHVYQINQTIHPYRIKGRRGGRGSEDAYYVLTREAAE